MILIKIFKIVELCFVDTFDSTCGIDVTQICFKIAIKLRWKQMFLRTPNATKQNINLHIKTGNCGLRPTYSIDIHVQLLEFNVRNNCR